MNPNTLYHLKEKIENDLSIMKNCLLVENKRIKRLKTLVVEAGRYEDSAKLREIEKALEEVLSKSKK